MKKIVLFVIIIMLTNVTIAKKKHSRPNIVFIMTDDLGYGDLGAYGQKLIETKHLDDLSKSFVPTLFRKG
ncbi:sulfatase-like hydrolase/transferase [Sphingobacterium sp. SRCM116780]|uniref:sulfatase-like hydrolase/transferase n=1 Tax=Sphingobacterium sp. SRCM116780 TaxID=2907623 RepID=UPI001F24C6B1|nr:sulfatase-like hydrolase/transferase [Sphingobacterium sp. SRCM116780]UIR55933.1 sulfatase-like hydrolase/transferase [Sphingobacterium sp. SRCM116780]